MSILIFLRFVESKSLIYNKIFSAIDHQATAYCDNEL